MKKQLIEEWDILYKSEDIDIDIKLKKTIQVYIENCVNSISTMVNPFDIIEEGCYINNVKRLIKGNNWIICMPNAFGRKVLSTPFTWRQALDSQMWTFGHILITIGAMDDIKKAFIRSHYRIHESNQELEDYINKIFLKAYKAQLKKKKKNAQSTEGPILGDLVPLSKEDYVRQLLIEIDDRNKPSNNKRGF